MRFEPTTSAMPAYSPAELMIQKTIEGIQRMISLNNIQGEEEEEEESAIKFNPAAKRYTLTNLTEKEYRQATHIEDFQG